MSWDMVRLDDVTPQPWRNGGGVTRELLAWPNGVDWRLRLSVAEVERSGPFSSYPGVTRWFAVLTGAGVLLRFDGAEHRLSPADAPLRFDGADAVECELTDGATQDFNLMVRDVRATMARVHDALDTHCQAGVLAAVYANAQPASVWLGADRIDLPPRTLAWRILGKDAALRISGADVLWMEIAT